MLGAGRAAAPRRGTPRTGSGEALPRAASTDTPARTEEEVRFKQDALRVSVVHQDTVGPGNANRRGWRDLYALGPVLGDGISAKVYEAEALTAAADVSAGQVRCGNVWRGCGSNPPCFAEHGRRVALKRFYRAKSRTFKKELLALQRVGVHPHILRLLESFEGFDGEDVLVLEYCDGSTVYELYARAHPQGGLPERLIARLVRQLLLALDHLTACGVEHQDVKPENMMLYDVSLSAGHAELKLGDFGWAVVAPQKGEAAPPKPPATGAGSLWYAPPELNPPVKGIAVEPESLVDVHGQPLRGRSDMWSVGVVVYLLLVGHNPFNLALKLRDQAAADAEVLRLAALGQFNRTSQKWFRLNADAQDFVSLLLRVKACARPSASDALHHPFLTRQLSKAAEASVFFHGPLSNWHGREEAWRQLDGLQQLGWMAIARAVAEPELDQQAISAALDSMQACTESRSRGQDDRREGVYLWQLARELGTSPVGQWLQHRTAWTEIIRLAFCYLDTDCDGVLSANDLAAHVSSLGPSSASSQDVAQAGAVSKQGAWSVADRWVMRWQDPDAPMVMSASGFQGLSLSSYRLALLASHCNDPIFEPFEAPASGRENNFDLHGEKAEPRDHPSFSQVVAGPHDHDEEEISWNDLAARGKKQAQEAEQL